MRRLFIEGELSENIIIRGADAHHLMHVMRAKAGQEITIVDGSSHIGRAELVEFTADTVTARLVERLEADTESPIAIELAQCLLKGDKPEFIVQKAVELGIVRIWPLVSANCVVRYDAKKSAARRSRWQRIAEEAAKQCGRTALTEVREIFSLEAWLEQVTADEDHLLLFCYENEDRQGLRACLRETRARHICLVIGPEGGFTLDEAELLRQHGARSVTLGPRILRAETAAVAAMSAVQYELGDLG